MRCISLGRLAASLALVASLSGCYQLVFEHQDEENLRSQFRGQADVSILSLNSSPKEPGFFVREGLRISGVYSSTICSSGTTSAKSKTGRPGKPVRFANYSPSIADEYSESAQQWYDRPLPAHVAERVKNLEHGDQILATAQGKYYCSVILGVRGARSDHPGGGYHHEWRNLGQSCSELPNLGNATIFTFGIRDMGAKKLYTNIAFSG